MPPTVLLTNRIPSEDLADLDGLARIIHGPPDGGLMPRAKVMELIREVDAIITNADMMVDEAMLDAASKLKIVAVVAIGTDNLDIPALTRRGVWATNVPDAFTETTGDAAMALLLAVARRIVECDLYVRSGAWARDRFQPERWIGMLLSGRTLGIVGYGRIGQAVERRARAFGMNVIYHRRTPSEDPGYRRFEDLLAESDVVSLHLPLTEQTTHLINRERLALMKRGAILINLARGKVMDEQAVVDALESGHLGGAALDVFENEPKIHPDLVKMDNVVLTPHIGGGTHESRRDARRLCAVNVALVLQGNPPRTPINQPTKVK